MAGSIKGIIVEIGGDTSKLQSALKKVNSSTSSLSKELRGINSLLKLDPKNTELVSQKQTVLKQNIEQTSKKLEELRKTQEMADNTIAKGGEISEENYRNLQREIINTERKLNNLKSDLQEFIVENSNWTKAGKQIGEYGEKITKASKKIDEIGNKISIVSGSVVAGETVLVNNAMNLEDAVAKYANTTNIAKEETEQYKQVLENINRNNYGEGYDDIATSMSNVKMQLKDINAQDLQNVTEKAIAFRDLFGYEVSESIRAVKAMMDNFKISSDEAFNLLAEGKKQGLDFSNELLDNVNEYSVQFKKLGLTADDMFNIFKSGAENGAFNLDKIGDAVKEFSIRAIDGSNTTIDGFKRLGLNANTMAKKFAQGGDTAKKAFIEVVQKIGSMNNKVEQSIVGVDLFGTMWEDLGPTVVTSFSKMDNGISKSSNSMQKSIDGLYNTTKKKAEAQLKRLQSLGADFGKEMLPTLEKIIDKAEDFIKSLEGMSKAEKENILKIGLFVASIGPATKALGTAGKVIGTTTKGIGSFSQAIGLMGKTSTEAFNNASNGTQILAKGLTGLTSSIGLATVAITATAGALVYFATKETEAQEKAREFAEEVIKQKQSYEDFNANIDKTTKANLVQIDSVSKLKNGLSTLVDENGKVKEGYKGRVSFILNELNSALGTEYKLNDNVVQSYKDLQSEIDATIEKKKAEIILEGKKEKYANAVNTEAEAVKKLKEAHENLGISLEEAKEKLQGLKDEAAINAEGNGTDYWTSKEIKNLENLITGYENAESTVKQCTEDKKAYETDYALFVEGKYNEIGKTITDTTKNWTNSSVKELQDSIIQQQGELDKYKQIYERTGNEVAEQQMKQAQQNLQNLADELVNRTSTIGTLGLDEISAWKTLANSSYEEYKNAISKMKPEMQQEIQDITGVIVADTGLASSTREKANDMTTNFKNKLELSGKTQEEINNISSKLNRDTSVESGAESLAQDANRGFNNNVDGTTWGSHLASNIAGGLASKQAKAVLERAANSAAATVAAVLHHTTPDKGPMKDDDKWMPDMIDNFVVGINKNKSKLTKSAEKMARDLNNALSINMNFPQVQDFGKFQGYINNKIIDSTKTIFTTPNLTIYTQEFDARKIANEVNKIFGSQY